MYMSRSKKQDIIKDGGLGYEYIDYCIGVDIVGCKIYKKALYESRGKLGIMNELQIIGNAITIKNTIGFAIFDEIDVVDHPTIICFCKIVDNYCKMVKLGTEVS